MKMKIEDKEFIIPSWASAEPRLYLVTNNEIVVEIVQGRNGIQCYIKESRCSKCGRCCRLERCKFLTRKNLCGFKRGIPFRCLVFIPKGIEECTVRYKEVE